MEPFLTIAEAGRQIAAKKLSPVELTSLCLDRVKKLDPTLHSFLLVTEDRAMADAKAAEARRMSATLKGPARRDPHRSQGHLQHRRHPHHGALQTAGAQRPYRGFRRRPEMGCRRQRADGQAFDA